MTWKIAVVDDQASAQKVMRSYFQRYTQEQGEQFRISYFENAELFLERYRPVFDVVLMDIDMPGKNGMDAAHRLRALDESVVLMFVINLAQYAIKGYEVSAVDYIVKPVTYSKFAFKLARALKLVPQKERASILIRTELGTVTVEQGQITYVEVQGHNLFYHTNKDVYRVRGSLRQAEDVLDPQEFFQLHKCYIVNLAYVEEVRGLAVVVAGDEISVSRPKKKAFMEALAAYHNG